MNDILEFALQRQRELREEIAELDSFVRLAHDLMRRVQPQTDASPDRPLREIASGRPAQEVLWERPVERAERPAAERAETPGIEARPVPPQDASAAVVHVPMPVPAPAPEPVLVVEEEERPEPVQGGMAERRFPWSGAQPTPRRMNSDDPLGPTRKNIFRRDASAAS